MRISTQKPKVSRQTPTAGTMMYRADRTRLVAEPIPLRVNTPGDAHEQEAERLSESAMRTPGHAATGQIDQRVGSIGSTTGGSPAPSVVHSVLRSDGEPLDAATRAYMEPRFGGDFAHVRVHADAEAAASAAAVDALAYTVGSRVVFGAGRYAPDTSQGRGLLAHELAHVLQQKGSAPVLQRAVTYPSPAITTTDPIRRTLSGSDNLALTTPTVNGTPFPRGIDAATAVIKRAFTPADVRTIAPPPPTYKAPENAPDGGTYPDAGPSPDAGSGESAPPTECAFKPFDVKISADIIQPTAPGRSQWGPITISGSDLGRGAPAICTGKSSIRVTMKGKPDTSTFYERIKRSELEHVSDLKSASNTFLVPYYAEIMALRGSGTDAASCTTDLQTKLGLLPETKIRDFLAQVLADIARRDTPGGHPTRSASNIKDDCNRIEITSEHKPAAGTP